MRRRLKLLDHSPSHHAVQRSPPDRAGSRPPPAMRARASRRCFRSRRDAALRPVDLVARHQRPGDARHLVRQRHRHQPDRTPLQQPPHPRPGGTAPLPGAVHHRRGAEHPQPSDLAVARLRDPAKAGFAAGRVLAWHPPEPGREVPRALEVPDAFTDRGREQRGGDRPDAGDRGQAPRRVVPPRRSPVHARRSPPPGPRSGPRSRGTARAIR